MAEVVVLTNPLDVSRRHRLRLGDGVPLLAWLDEHEPAPAPGAADRVVYVNDHTCTDASYRTRPGDEVLVLFVPSALTPAGLLIYALQAVFSLAISLALSAIFSPHKPAAADAPPPSQVYGIAPPQNAARLGQPIPVIYGNVVALPDFAAQPYTFFKGNDQFLHAILCLGMGEVDVLEMLLAQTSTSTLSPGIVKYTVWKPVQHRSTFGVIQGQTGIRENVVTSPAVGDQELVPPNMGGRLVPSTWYWVLSGTATSLNNPGGVQLQNFTDPANKLAALPASPTLGTAVFCTIGYNGSTYTSGTYTATAYDPAAQPAPGDLVPPDTYDQSGVTKWLGYFTSCKPGQHGVLLEFDFVFPSGLFKADASGNYVDTTVHVTVEAQPINDAGANAGALLTYDEVFTAHDNTPQRFTRQHYVAAGSRFKVRAARITPSDLKVTTQDHVIWAGLKFQLDAPPVGTATYGNVTLVSVEMKATNGIAQSASGSMRFRCVRRLMYLANDTGTNRTANPADAFADILCADYGGARPPTADELDLPVLIAAHTDWATVNGFNAVFDQTSTVWEALALSVQTVHAAPLPVGSRMSLVHDRVQPVRVQLFTDANIVAGSLQVTANFDAPGTPEGLRVNYRDAQSFSAQALLQPVDAPDYVTLDLFGCTDVAVAQEHANLTLAKRDKQRMAIHFDTELEGMNCLPGDRIGVQAGMVKWAQGARVERVLGSTLTLDAALVWTAGATHAVQLRDPSGAPVRVVGVTRGGADNVLVLPGAPPFTLTPIGSSMEATALAFGVQDSEVTDWTVVKITPNGANYTIDAVNYDPTIYAGAAAFTRGELALDDDEELAA